MRVARHDQRVLGGHDSLAVECLLQPTHGVLELNRGINAPKVHIQCYLVIPGTGCMNFARHIADYAAKSGLNCRMNVFEFYILGNLTA